MDEAWTDKTAWWNKIQSMTEEELDVLPDEYLKKFGNFLMKTQEMQLMSRLDMNKENMGRDQTEDGKSWFEQIKDKDRLLTDEEKQRLEEQKRKWQEADFSYAQTDYWKMQPRLDLPSLSYNQEQFRRFTSFYDDAKKKDEA